MYIITVARRENEIAYKMVACTMCVEHLYSVFPKVIYQHLRNCSIRFLLSYQNKLYVSPGCLLVAGTEKKNLLCNMLEFVHVGSTLKYSITVMSQYLVH